MADEAVELLDSTNLMRAFDIGRDFDLTSEIEEIKEMNNNNKVLRRMRGRVENGYMSQLDDTYYLGLFADALCPC